MRRAKLLVDQLRDFPCGEHDDGPGALKVTFRLACEGLSARYEEECQEWINVPIEYRT